ASFMKHLSAWATGLMFLAGCNSGKSPEEQSPNPPAQEPATAQEQLAAAPGEIQGLTPPVKRRGKVLAPVRGPRNLDALVPPESTEELSFDAGRVIAGEVLTHTFHMKNSSPEAIAVKQEKDIQLDCGCSAIEPKTRVLQPGDQADVTVTVRTGDLKRKKGPFAHGGKIWWTAESGRRHVTSLLLRGEVLPPFASDPPVLTFTPEEVKSGAAKELV